MVSMMYFHKVYMEHGLPFNYTVDYMETYASVPKSEHKLKRP